MVKCVHSHGPASLHTPERPAFLSPALSPALLPSSRHQGSHAPGPRAPLTASGLGVVFFGLDLWVETHTSSGKLWAPYLPHLDVPTLGSRPQDRARSRSLTTTKSLQGRQARSVLVAGSLTATWAGLGGQGSAPCSAPEEPALPAQGGRGQMAQSPTRRSLTGAPKSRRILTCCP